MYAKTLCDYSGEDYMHSELCTHGLLWEEGDKVQDMHHDVCILMLIAESLLGFFPIQRGVSQ